MCLLQSLRFLRFLTVFGLLELRLGVSMAAMATMVGATPMVSHEGLRFRTSKLSMNSSSVQCRVATKTSFVVRATAEVQTKSAAPTIEECEAAVVAGNAPAAPAVPQTPKMPEGTPKISPLVSECVVDFARKGILCRVAPNLNGNMKRKGINAW